MKFRVLKGSLSLSGKCIPAPGCFECEPKGDADNQHLCKLVEAGIIARLEEEAQEVVAKVKSESGSIDTSKYDGLSRPELFQLIQGRGKKVSAAQSTANLKRFLAKMDQEEAR